MSEPYPRTDDGEYDHEAACEQMFGHEPTNRRPVFINDGAETLAVVDFQPESGELTFASLEVVVNPSTWTGDLRSLWDEWMNGSLTFRQEKFLKTEEAVYDAEREAAISRTSLAELADYLATAIGDVPEECHRDRVQAVQEAYDALDYDWDADPRGDDR